MNNNEFYQNAMINIRKDNDEWKNAASTCSPELIKKNITENGTYNASDDGADGYSSVTVNVPFTWERIDVYLGIAVNNESEFTLTNTSSLSSHTLANPLTKYVNNSNYPSFSFAFTPAEDFDGIYRSGGTTKYTFTGDEVTAGDGHIYVAEINAMGNSYTMTKKNCYC